MQNFFEKLNKLDVEALLKKNFFEKAQLTVQTVSGPRILKVKLICANNDKFGKIYILPQEVEELAHKVCAFSFRVGTQVYFFKEKIQFDNKGFFAQVGFEIFELRRRRHVRYEVLENFDYEAFMFLEADQKNKFDIQLINFSESGARFTISLDLALFQKGNHVNIAFKVGKRAAFSVAAQIKFVGRKPKENPVIGAEFVKLDLLTKNKILSICEDLTRLHFQVRKTKNKMS